MKETSFWKLVKTKQNKTQTQNKTKQNKKQKRVQNGFYDQNDDTVLLHYMITFIEVLPNQA